MKQLREMKEQMDTAKEWLNTISVKGECQGVTVISNGNRKIMEVIIPQDLRTDTDREELAELILTATNRALENAENVFEVEMKGMAGGMMGGLGLF